MKKALALITCVVMLLSLIYVDAYAQMKTTSIAEDNQHVLSDENVQPSDTIFELITNYITYLDTHQYEKITNLLCDEEKAEFTAFIQNQDNRETFTGFFIQKMQVLFLSRSSRRIINPLVFIITMQNVSAVGIA